MTEEKKQTKKKVYVETTVVSDATALPTNDLSVAGRQITTHTWSARAMTLQQEDTLEEMWRIKREIAEEYPTWEAYAAGILAFQEEERKRGVKFANVERVKPSFTLQ